MEYHLLAFDNKQNYEVIDKFQTFDEAEKKKNKLIKKQEQSPIEIKTKPTKNKKNPTKNLNKEYKIFNIPEIKAGLKIYCKGIYYKTIVGETKSLWFLNNIDKLEKLDDFTMKEHIYHLFYTNVYDCDKEEYDNNYTKNIYDPKTDINICSDYKKSDNTENESEEI